MQLQKSATNCKNRSGFLQWQLANLGFYVSTPPRTVDEHSRSGRLGVSYESEEKTLKTKIAPAGAASEPKSDSAVSRRHSPMISIRPQHSAKKARAEDAWPEQAVDDVALLRKPSRKPDPSDGLMIVAADARARSAKLSGDPRWEFVMHLSNCMNRMVPADAQLCRLGLEIVRSLNFVFSRGAARKHLGLNTADDEMCQALMAGLIGAFATARGPVDLDAVRHGIASFIHAHPAFATVRKSDAWKPPFGKHTIYRIVRAPTSKPTR
jgi:hypothetical protein